MPSWIVIAAAATGVPCSTATNRRIVGSRCSAPMYVATAPATSYPASSIRRKSALPSPASTTFTHPPAGVSTGMSARFLRAIPRSPTRARPAPSNAALPVSPSSDETITVGATPLQIDDSTSSSVAGTVSRATPDTVDRNPNAGSDAHTTSKPAWSHTRKRPAWPASLAASHANPVRR